MICPNQPLHCDANSRLGSTGEPLTWYISQPAKCGPLTSHRSRFPSDVRTNAPLRVPTKTRTPLICHSSPFVVRPLEKRTLDFAAAKRYWFPSRFDWYPNLHAARPGPRIELLGITLAKAWCFSGTAGSLKAGSREPLVDGIQRFTEFGNMSPVGENGVFLCWNRDDAEVAGKT